MILKLIAMALDYFKRDRNNVSMNWKILIQNLIDNGLTQVQIAERCHTGQSHISGLLTGYRKCPNWHLGEMLRNLHIEVCGFDPFAMTDQVDNDHPAKKSACVIDQ